jgi:hypothetical protein
MIFEQIRRLREPSIRIPLWLLRHASGHTIECSMRTHPDGLEFQAKLNTRLLHSEVFGSVEELMRSAERGKGRLQSRGWTAIAADSN